MKHRYVVTLILLLVLAALPAPAQNAKVTLKMENVPLSEVMSEIESQTSYTFFYDSGTINPKTSKVSVDADNQPLSKILDDIFAPLKIKVETKGSQIVLTPAKSSSKSSRTVKGTVLDEDGYPVIGAGVLIKGTSTGVSTDVDGNYEISGVSDGDVLEIISLGFANKNVTVGKSDKIDVVLATDNELLESVVVVGFGTQKRENLTGAVATISAKELNDRPVVNAAAALQGLDPSVNLTMGTGSPESTYNIDIRGAASINSASPLILVDGIEMDLRAVNPNDIESMSVLKDASAASIYGAKASPA